MSNTRIYIIKNKVTDQQVLVEAATHAQALRFACQQTYESKVASTTEVAKLVREGLEVYDATAVAEPTEPEEKAA